MLLESEEVLAATDAVRAVRLVWINTDCHKYDINIPMLWLTINTFTTLNKLENITKMPHCIP